MVSYEFYNPLRPAKIFLSHAPEDNESTDTLYKDLSHHFDVYYDRAIHVDKKVGSRLFIGHEMIPFEKIGASDIFLFIASESSLQPRSRSNTELGIALNLPPRTGPRVLFISLDNYEVPVWYNISPHLQLRHETRNDDTQHIIRYLEALLIEEGGLYRPPSPLGDSDLELVGGSKPEVILEHLTSNSHKGIYTLNAVFPYAEHSEVKELLQAQDPKTRDTAVKRLIEIFVTGYTDQNLAIARMNAIIIAAKLLPGETSIVTEVKRRSPDFPTPLLYRGFHIALGLLGSKANVIEYALALENKAGPEWDEQRAINLKFHHDYYGGIEPTIGALRSRIQLLEPDYILALDVYTLGEFSNSRMDSEMLRKMKVELVNRGVPKKIIASAIKRIEGRIQPRDSYKLTKQAESQGQLAELLTTMRRVNSNNSVLRAPSNEFEIRNFELLMTPNKIVASRGGLATDMMHTTAEPRSDHADFVIITALEEERDAVLRKFANVQRIPSISTDIRVYHRAELAFKNPDGTSSHFTVAVLCLLQKGRVEAATATGDAIRRWHPRYVLLVGIAGGIAETGVSLGDVLVSNQIVDYELQEITPEGPKVRYNVYRADPRLLAAAQSLVGEEWLPIIQQKRPRKGTPRRIIGPLATGDKVIAFKPVLDAYQEDWPKLIGVEMEAGGVASAAFEAADKPGFFMVRGVSDLADSEKDSPGVKAWRAYACDIAASYIVALLRSDLMPTR
jgi:nucleoside phosphorylase